MNEGQIDLEAELRKERAEKEELIRAHEIEARDIREAFGYMGARTQAALTLVALAKGAGIVIQAEKDKRAELAAVLVNTQADLQEAAALIATGVKVAEQDGLERRELMRVVCAAKELVHQNLEEIPEEIIPDIVEAVNALTPTTAASAQAEAARTRVVDASLALHASLEKIEDEGERLSDKTREAHERAFDAFEEAAQELRAMLDPRHG